MTSDSKIRKTIIDPFGTTSVENYEYLYEEFGIEPFKPLLPKIPELPQQCVEEWSSVIEILNVF